MNKRTELISIILLSCFAAAAVAKPIDVSQKAVSVSPNSTELRRIELAGYNSAAEVEDSTQLKIMGNEIFDQAPLASLDPGTMTLSNRSRPLTTQAMSAQSSFAATSMGRGNLSPISAATRPTDSGATAASAASAPPDNNVIPVPEPPLLMLLGLCLLLVAVRRKR